jgi:predicted nucleic acid-binding protein
MPLAPPLELTWKLRENFTPYAVAYIALAERLPGPVIMCDAKMTTATCLHCSFDHIS